MWENAIPLNVAFDVCDGVFLCCPFSNLIEFLWVFLPPLNALLLSSPHP